MDLDRLYKLGKTFAVFALTLLLVSLTIKVWCENGCGKGKYSRCADFGSFKNEDISVFTWDSDSSKIDIKAILESEDFDRNIKEILKKVIKDVDIEIDVNGTERKKKVIVKVFGD